MDRGRARPWPPSGPPPPRCPRWCSRAAWPGTAPSSTRRRPASPCSAPRTTPSCSARSPCPRWVGDILTLIQLILSLPHWASLMTFNTQHIPPVTATQNIVTMSHGMRIVTQNTYHRTHYTRRRFPGTLITQPAPAQRRTRPPHPRWDKQHLDIFGV